MISNDISCMKIYLLSSLRSIVTEKIHVQFIYIHMKFMLNHVIAFSLLFIIISLCYQLKLMSHASRNIQHTQHTIIFRFFYNVILYSEARFFFKYTQTFIHFSTDIYILHPKVFVVFINASAMTISFTIILLRFHFQRVCAHTNTKRDS